MTLTEQTAETLMALKPELPPEKAVRKAQSLGRGIAFFLLGALCFLGAFGLVIAIVLTTKGTPSIAILVFAAILAVPGAYFLFAGGHIVSGEAMEAAAVSGNVVFRTAAKALRLARAKDPAAPGGAP